jgi:hypothetical protein
MPANLLVPTRLEAYLQLSEYRDGGLLRARYMRSSARSGSSVSDLPSTSIAVYVFETGTESLAEPPELESRDSTGRSLGFPSSSISKSPVNLNHRSGLFRRVQSPPALYRHAAAISRGVNELAFPSSIADKLGFDLL